MQRADAAADMQPSATWLTPRAAIVDTSARVLLRGIGHHEPGPS